MDRKEVMDELEVVSSEHKQSTAPDSKNSHIANVTIPFLISTQPVDQGMKQPHVITEHILAEQEQKITKQKEIEQKFKERKGTAEQKGMTEQKFPVTINGEISCSILADHRRVPIQETRAGFRSYCNNCRKFIDYAIK